MLACCPECRYSLQGLPEKRNCPECGFLYDRNGQIFRRSPTGLLLFGGVGAIMSLTGFVLRWWFGEWFARGAGAAILATVGLMAVLTSAWRLKRQSPYVLVSRNDVRIVQPNGKERMVPINQIHSARWSRLHSAVFIMGHHGEELALITYRVLGTNRRLKQVASIITAYIESPRVRA